MAKIVGTVNTSHIPAIGGAIHKGLQNDPYWKPFFDGFPPVRDWLASVRPDVVIVAYNDHGLNFFLDKMPTFAVGAAAEYRNADEGWGIPVLPPFQGDQALSWHLIESLVGEDFDLVTCQEMVVDHALTLPMALLWPDQNWPVRDHSGGGEHRAGAAALRRPLLQTRPGDRPRGRLLAGRRTGCRAGHRRPVAPVGRGEGRVHQQGLRPASSSTA